MMMDRVSHIQNVNDYKWLGAIVYKTQLWPTRILLMNLMGLFAFPYVLVIYSFTQMSNQRTLEEVWSHWSHAVPKSIKCYVMQFRSCDRYYSHSPSTHIMWWHCVTFYWPLHRTPLMVYGRQLITGSNMNRSWIGG